MQWQTLLPVILLSLFVWSGCQTEKTTMGPLSSRITQWRSGGIYRNSFETPGDTAGWQGNGTFRFEREAPPGGGNQCLYVSGSCTIPHAFFDLPPRQTAGYYLLRCWGKDLQIGGSVILSRVNDSSDRHIALFVNQPEWRRYQSTDTLFCPAGEALRVELNAGGFVSSAMLVDLLEIVRVK